MGGRLVGAVVVGLVLVLNGVTAASSLEDRLEGELRGAWVVIGTEVYSSCDAYYNDNTVNPGGVASKASRRFEPGELGKVDKVKVKRSRVDLLVTLDQPILASRLDGPFELYDERSCKLQLIFEMPREWLRREDLDQVRGRLLETVTTFRDRAAAQAEERWNGRQREAYPDGYELTLARHARWQAEQLNAAVAARLDQAVHDAADIADDVRSDPGYLEGFAAGLAKMRERWPPDCDGAITTTLYSAAESPPSGSKDAFKRGWQDGQALLFNLRLAERLRGCFVPVPDAP